MQPRNMLLAPVKEKWRGGRASARPPAKRVPQRASVRLALAAGHKDRGRQPRNNHRAGLLVEAGRTYHRIARTSLHRMETQFQSRQRVRSKALLRRVRVEDHDEVLVAPVWATLLIQLHTDQT